MNQFREIGEVKWADGEPTPEQILLHGIAEIARLAPGGHADPTNPCYGVKRDFKSFAGRIQDAYELARRRPACEGCGRPYEYVDDGALYCPDCDGDDEPSSVAEGTR